MKRQKFLLLLVTALASMPVPVLAQDAPSSRLGQKIEKASEAEDGINTLEAAISGFEEVYARADLTGLKVPLVEVDASFLHSVPLPPLIKPDPFRLERFQNEGPPALEGIEWTGDNLADWVDYLDVKVGEALERNDKAASLAAIDDILFLSASAAEESTPYGPNSNRYLDALGRLFFALDAQVAAPTADEVELLMSGDKTIATRLEEREHAARRALPAADQQRMLDASARYLALRSFAGSLGENDIPMVERRIELLGESRPHESEQLKAFSKALKRRAAMEQYNAMINTRQQNIEILKFDGAAMWAESGLNAALQFMDDTDPLLLRYSLLVAAEAIGGERGSIAEQALQVAKKACVAQKCGSLESQPGYIEGAGLLKEAKLSAAIKRYESAVRGGVELADGAEQAIMLQKIARNLCYNEGETNARDSSRLTQKGELHAAQCDLDHARGMLSLLEARGDSLAGDGEYRANLLTITEASAKLGDWQEVLHHGGKLYKVYQTEKEVSGEVGLILALLVEGNIKTANFGAADRYLVELEATFDKLFKAGVIMPHHYRQYLQQVASLRTHRQLADPAQASAAYQLANDIARRERAWRESLSTGISDESALGRVLSSQEAFTPVLDAAFARRASIPAQAAGVTEQAFLAAQDATLDPTSVAIGMSAAAEGLTSNDPELTQLIRRRRELLNALTPHLGVDASTEFSFDAKAALVLKQNQAKIDQQIIEYEQIDSALRERFPEYFDLIRPAALSSVDARALLKSDEAVLLVVPTEWGTHTMVVTQTGVSWSRAPLTSGQLAAKVERLLWFAGASVSPPTAETEKWASEVDGGRSGFDRRTAFALHQELLGPHGEALEGKTKLYVSALGSVSSLPLSVLVTAIPEGRDDDLSALAATKWLSDRFVISQLPSLQSLAFLRRASAPQIRSGNTFLGIGDPALAPSPSQLDAKRGLERVIAPDDVYASEDVPANAQGSQLADVDALRKLPELVGSGQELRALASAMSAGEDRLRLRDRAREAVIKQEELSDVSVLAFATHGLLAGELKRGQFPGLVLTPPDQATEEDDGLLTAPEIARLKLAADWVILSACNTASGDGSEGAGALSGLARAFFTAGAKSLLVSHWPVLDDLSATLTVKALTHQAANPALSSADAFHRAQREVRSERRWAHPRSWAPFTFIGDASPRSVKTASR